MFKDYYKILGVNPLSSYSDIKSAYKRMSKKWHPDVNPEKDVTSVMQDINEAYAILCDEDKRVRYDREYQIFMSSFDQNEYKVDIQDQASWDYDYDIKDECLKTDINAARQYAKKLVDEFMESFKKASQRASKGAWDSAKSFVYIGVFLFVFGFIVKTCLQLNVPPTKTKIIQSATSLPSFEIPSTWMRHHFKNSFFISVPSTIELRKDNDVYTKNFNSIQSTNNTDVVVFQQKGLSSVSKKATNSYCRIMIQYGYSGKGDFLRSNQIEEIEYESKSFFRDLVNAELGPYKLLDEPSYRWIDIEGINAVEIKYRRSGSDNNTTACAMYLLFNYDEMVRMIISYREQEKELWLPDLDNIIKTFKWG